MSKLNLTRKTFLEKEELNRFQDMLEDNAVKSTILGNTTNWGIIRDEFETEDLNFKVEQGTNSGTIKIAKSLSKAIDKDGLIITQPAINNVPIPEDGEGYWVRVSHKYRRWEKGEVNISASGEMSGSNTLFLETLRGQSTNVPTKIRFAKEDGSTPINRGIYEVVTVGSNINAILSSAVGFESESGLKMIVIGATPISEILTSEQLEGLYKYDDCNLEIVAETTSNIPPISGAIQDKTFYIARVKNESGSLTIEDKRENLYWAFNVPGVTDRLSKFENLNDLSNKSVARANLDVYNKSEVASLISAGSSAGALLAANNLSDLTDKTTARSNLDVFSTIQVNEALNLKADDDAVTASINQVSVDLGARCTSLEGRATSLEGRVGDVESALDYRDNWVMTVNTSTATSGSVFVYQTAAKINVVTGIINTGGHDDSDYFSVAYIKYSDYPTLKRVVGTIYGVACLNLDRSCPVRLRNHNVSFLGDILELAFKGSTDSGDSYHFNIAYPTI